MARIWFSNNDILDNKSGENMMKLSPSFDNDVDGDESE
jgi:hypothetical protein